MKIQLLRHATLLVELAGKSALVDPMLSPAEAWDPVRNSANPQRNPMVDLPLSESELAGVLTSLDAVFVTHTHADHWDDAAKASLSKQLPLFCQPHDQASLWAEGFGDVRPVEDRLTWQDLTVHRTGGRHGTGEVAERIGPVSGFVLTAEGEPSLYVAGDTVWCPEVAQALETHKPDLIVLNAGAAQFLDSDPITMAVQDVLAVAEAAPEAQLVAVHMQTINHCQLSRAALAAAASQAGLDDRLWIPADGESREL